MITREVWGSRLKRLRQRAGLSQATLAQEMGVAQQTVGAWETGRSLPRPDIRVALAVRLGDTIQVLESALSGDDDPAWEERLPPLTVKAGDHRRRKSDREMRAQFLGLLRARLVEEGHTEFANSSLDEIEVEFQRRFGDATVTREATPRKTSSGLTPDYRIDLGDGIIVDVETKLDRDRPLDNVGHLARRRLLTRQRLLQGRVRVMVAMADREAGTEFEKALLSVVTMLVARQSEVERLVEAQAQMIEDALRGLGKTARVVASSREIVDRIEELLRERPWEHKAVLG